MASTRISRAERRICAEHFFNSPELKALVADLSDDEVWKRNRGGHDPFKVCGLRGGGEHREQPTVILAKRQGLRDGRIRRRPDDRASGEKMTQEALKQFRDRFDIQMPDDRSPRCRSSRCRRTWR
jgi:pyruvate dehydrogenase E1 component